MTFIKPLPDSAPMFDTAPPMPAPAPTWKYPMPVQPSIDLRDWFAGMALQGVLINDPDWTDDELSKIAYEIADAMLKAREAK